MQDPNKTQIGAPADPNRTQLGSPVDPNRTIMGSPTYEATVTIKPVQCPVCKTFNPVAMMFCVECGLIFDKALDGDAFGAPAVQLPVLVDGNGREYTLRPGENVVGRQGDISVEDVRVSRRHALLRIGQDGVTVEDIGSTNGTAVDGNRLDAGEQKAVGNKSVISLGGFELTLSLPNEVNKTLAAATGKTAAISVQPSLDESVGSLSYGESEIPLLRGLHKFGRRADNSIVISDPYVSGSHGEIEVTDTGVFLTDTGSTNGTYVNDAKLSVGQRTQIVPTDEIRLGQLPIVLKLKG